MMYYIFTIKALSLLLFFSSPGSPESVFEEHEEVTEVVENEPVLKQYLTGRFSPKEHPDFTRIGQPFAAYADMYLRREAMEAFEQMHAAAREDGIRLTILSATRTFNVQKYIWEAKWMGKKTIEDGNQANLIYLHPGERAKRILKFSAMPGTSRHHWGTEIDLNQLNNDYFEEGYGRLVYEWLVDNAHAYGFCQPYSEKGKYRPFGHNEEKWHWSYIPLSSSLTKLADEIMQDEDITGFMGSEYAGSIGVVEKYILGLNSNCFKYWK
jgi:D-alanyl-D-alanine carboxypeptidase